MLEIRPIYFYAQTMAKWPLLRHLHISSQTAVATLAGKADHVRLFSAGTVLASFAVDLC